MSEKDQEKIDALFMGYLDGELNERQRTELKRLLLTYPSLAAELRELRQQKALLGALPVAKAPATLAADVQAALERNMILGSKEAREQGRCWDTGLLFVRRIAAAAAMLLIPVGLLSLLVFQIMRPAAPVPGDPDPLGRQTDIEKTLRPQYVTVPAESDGRAIGDAGRLVLFTDQPLQVNRFIEKRIHLHRLLNETMPEREAKKTVYGIECTSEQSARFVGDLADVWPRCSDAQYTLSGGEAETPVVVDRIQPRQLVALMRAPNADQKRRSAMSFARLNRQSDDFHRPASPTEGDLTPPQPVTAWDSVDEESAPAVQEGPRVRFTLEVLSADGASN